MSHRAPFPGMETWRSAEFAPREQQQSHRQEKKIKNKIKKIIKKRQPVPQEEPDFPVLCEASAMLNIQKKKKKALRIQLGSSQTSLGSSFFGKLFFFAGDALHFAYHLNPPALLWPIRASAARAKSLFIYCFHHIQTF